VSQSLAQVYLHLLFSTKERRPYLQDAAVRTALHHYLGATCRNLESPSLGVVGVADHVHVLCRLSRTQTIAVLVRELKRESSKWLKTKGAGLGSFQWQEGYGAFSIGASQVEAVRRCIARQEEHHRRRSFQDEFRAFLQKYGVEYDVRYVWD
jgi:REP element-mobilizing transposase RayT